MKLDERVYFVKLMYSIFIPINNFYLPNYERSYESH